ncbi:TetR/AcrR family transcriptional regulator [Sphingomonas sp. So64.6b]|uniref:TetR/AcrR family transcriptional regulator n=1 Tax=Sphingomonas sp. So64.6b TaxID=2997354 RepID=UPI0016005A86|nr:TetR/AcrR family transcriptional regulator [Sphingomonas sp. So64.6b]QNA84360.1 TetR/AcrR family transcriptional regulator [Sphingomonas sp. So64.6b]
MTKPRAAAPTRAVAKAPPKQARAQQTREHLLDIAGGLLAEVGMERISTNMICTRAGVTPPALYRYFEDKYAVIEALGRRLMDRQNEVLIAWMDRHLANGIDAVTAHIEELLRETARITESEPGGVWIERALHATPKLAHVRIESHRYVTDRQVEAFAPFFPDLPREVLWRRIRMAVEFGYVADEMLSEEDRIPPDDVFAEASRMLRLVLLGDDKQEAAK